MTVLFADLVGFTSRAEEMDPEDVAALLGPYHARLKEELERYGGTVEKFIGDAVMALFGAPIAHEDDPERAVRAALAIREIADEQGVELRIGISTGEAFVNLDARPDAGETMATGDVVNTAARLQSAAPVNGILVSEQTREATKRAIEYDDAESVQAKGKARPVRVWEAISAAPLQDRSHTTPLVGRERELGQLREALVRARDDRTPQLVTLVGEPGIGKSRLVYEVFQGNSDVAWRKGRCLPYGDGVAFWALGEIVKAQLGILESDSIDRAEEKLVSSVDDTWVAGHLRPLVGVGEERESLGDRRAEAFAAWRRFLTALAEERPLALVLEDVHWADDALLDFITHLVEWAQESPLLVICTARPELLERRPAWGATATALSPLSDAETGRLFSALVEIDASEDLLTRTAGNPLYAEQYARLLAEGGSLEDLPTTVQETIAARLDGLPADEKSLLQDAAVIGEVFWSAAVAALAGDDRWAVEERLLALERRELVQREQPSAVQDEEQYAFRHILVRDVAYGQIPRGARADKHRLAAEWIEGIGRSDDHAEMLAHHYLSALEYARAAGRTADELAGRARSALSEAGDRASAVYAFAAAARSYGAALELSSAEDAGRPQLLLRYGRALWMADGGGSEVLLDAAEELVASADRERAAEAEVLLARFEWFRGHRDRADSHMERAVELVDDTPRSRSKAYVLGDLARSRLLAGAHEDAIRLGYETLSLAQELGLDVVQANALMTVGVARWRNGDSAGIADVERSVEIARAASSPVAIRACTHLGFALFCIGQLDRSSELIDEALQWAERFGDVVQARFVRAGVERVLQIHHGRWDDALNFANELVEEAEMGSPDYHEAECRQTRAAIRLARDDLEDVIADCVRALELSRAAKDPQQLVPVLAGCARVFVETGRMNEAAALADELSDLMGRYRATWELCDIAVVLVTLGRIEELRAGVDAAKETRWADAIQHYVTVEFERAAEVFAEMGVPRDEADARLRAAEKLVGEGRRTEADEQLQRALAFYRSVGATRYIRQGEELLAASA